MIRKKWGELRYSFEERRWEWMQIHMEKVFTSFIAQS